MFGMDPISNTIEGALLGGNKSSGTRKDLMSLIPKAFRGTAPFLSSSLFDMFGLPNLGQGHSVAGGGSTVGVGATPTFAPPNLGGGMNVQGGGSTVGIGMGPQSRAEKFDMTNQEALKVLQDIRDGIKKLSDKPGLNLFGVEIT